MSDRVIHCSDYEPRPDSPACRWLEANGVKPRTVPLDSTITVSGGQITYEFVDPKPNRDYSQPPPRQLRTVPLISPPEAHGL